MIAIKYKLKFDLQLKGSAAQRLSFCSSFFTAAMGIGFCSSFKVNGKSQLVYSDVPRLNVFS